MARPLLASLPILAALSGMAQGDGLLDDLTVAAVRGDLATTERLLESGADPNRPGWQGLTALSAAMRSCRVTAAVVDALIAAGADLEARSGVGATPLMVAYQMGRADLAEVLIAAGADPEATNMYGDTARDYAAYFHGAADGDFATLRYTSFGFSARAPGNVPVHCKG